MTKIDREGVDPLHVKSPDGITRRVDEHYFVPSDVQQDPHGAWLAIQNLCAALNEAEAERHRWRQAAAKGSLHTQADLDRAVAEARAVALKEAAEVAAYEADFVPVKPDDFRKAILALIDTPAAEALERVQTEERAKGMERAGTILLDNPHSTRWHVLEAIRAEAAAIRAQETDNA